MNSRTRANGVLTIQTKEENKMNLEMSIVQSEEKRILELIPQATKVDIVSAWVTPMASFKELVRRAKEQVQDNIFFN